VVADGVVVGRPACGCCILSVSMLCSIAPACASVNPSCLDNQPQAQEFQMRRTAPTLCGGKIR
jgi:hypothetical protein